MEVIGASRQVIIASQWVIRFGGVRIRKNENSLFPS